mgnify:CR=1 FL=1
MIGEKRAIAPVAQVVAVREAAGQDDDVAPLRSVSLCQRYSASWPEDVLARRGTASWSQLLPGKTTMPNFMISPPRCDSFR